MSRSLAGTVNWEVEFMSGRSVEIERFRGVRAVGKMAIAVPFGTICWPQRTTREWGAIRESARLVGAPYLTAHVGADGAGARWSKRPRGSSERPRSRRRRGM